MLFVRKKPTAEHGDDEVENKLVDIKDQPINSRHRDTWTPTIVIVVDASRGVYALGVV